MTVPRRWRAALGGWICLGLLGLTPQAWSDPAQAPASGPGQQVIQWVQQSRDNGLLPFIVVDKPKAQAWAFTAEGVLRGTAPVLLGAALGDLSVPGIGQRPLLFIRPEERTTPAGRFEAEIGRNTSGEEVLWVDYEAAVSMHRVRANLVSEQRLQRLATPTPEDNHISYGCINTPLAFFDEVVLPLLRTSGGRAVVYVLPQVLPLAAVFPRLNQVGAAAVQAVAP